MNNFQKFARSRSSQSSGSRLLAVKPLAASDGELDAADDAVSLKSDGNRSNPNLLDIPSGQDIGRVSSWAIGFSRLLQDELGLACFTEFLKREFSEENIMFWIACETMSKMTKPEELKRMSEHIYSKHLSDDASMPVNLDSSCRSKVMQALKSPTAEMYKTQQQQIFKLMKFDSYSRFLKSKVYQDCVLAEMAGNPLPVSFNRQRSDGSVSSTEGDTKKSTQKGNKKKYQIWKTGKSYNLDISEDNTDKKRKSLLPWNRVPKKFGKDPESPKDTGNIRSLPDQQLGRDTSLSEKTRDSLNGKAQGIAVEGICRLVFPNDDVVVVPARRGFTVRDVLAPHLEVRQLNFQTVETFLADSKDILDYNQDMGNLSGAEVVVEQRVVFRMELPSHRVIGVKSKPNKKLIEVLRPVTHKYNLQIDALVVHLSTSPVPLDLDITVATLDGGKILIETLEQYGAGNYQARASVGTASTALASSLPKLHKSASEESFVRKYDSRPAIMSQLQRRFSDSGSHANDRADEGRDSKGQRIVLRSDNTTDGSMQETKSHNRKYKASNHDAEELYTMLSRAQRRRMDDQRGLTIKNLDLPDFLKKPTTDTSAHRPKSALGTPYQRNKVEFHQTHDNTQRFYDMALRCKSTPPTPYNEDIGFKEGVIPSLDQADAVFGGRGRSSDIAPGFFNESMTAMPGGYYDDSNFDISFYGSDSNSTLRLGGANQTSSPNIANFNPPVSPTSHSIDASVDYDFRGRDFLLNGFGAVLTDASGVIAKADTSCNDKQGYAERQEASSRHSEYDLDQTITKSISAQDSFLLPPPPEGLDQTLRLEEANYSPPPPVVPAPDSLEICSGDGNLLSHSMPHGSEIIQGSTLPGHVTDLCHQPLTDTDSVTFGDDPVSDDILLPRTPSPSTHDLVMTPHQDEEDALQAPIFSFQTVTANPDVLESVARPEMSTVPRMDSSQTNTSQGGASSHETPQFITFHPAASNQTAAHKETLEDTICPVSFSQPTSGHSSTLQTNIYPSVPFMERQTSVDATDSGAVHSAQSQGSTSSSSGLISNQGINLQWKVSAGVGQQRVDESKWETVVKDGRTMRATFV